MSVPITHLQLNTELLKSPSAVLSFIENQKIDIACLQEVYYPIGGPNSLRALIDKAKLHYAEGVSYYNLADQYTATVAIVSRFPIIDHQMHYFNPGQTGPRTITPNDLLGPVLGNNQPDYPRSRAVHMSVLSFCVLSTVIRINDSYIRVITSHFPVSDQCIETDQIYRMGQLVCSIIRHSADLPTIFSGDLNITHKSHAITDISRELTHHTLNLADTLSQHHPSKTNGYPDGLAVDHVFSKHLEYLDTTSDDVDFSDHKALTSRFLTLD